MEEFSMKTVKSLFKEGVEKNEIFNRAIEAGLDKKEISAYLARRPDQALVEKYNIASKILVWILSILILFGVAALLTNPDLSSAIFIVELIFWLPVISYIMYLIYKKQAYVYGKLSVMLLIVMLKSAVYSAEYFTGLGILVVMGSQFVLILYVLILERKLFPYQNFFGLRENGEGVYIYTQNLTKQTTQI